MFEVLSFGGGVQSTAMLIMAIKGDLPKPDVVIFSDTGSELPETIAHIKQRVIPECEKHGIDFRITSKKDAKGEPLPLHEGYLRKSSLPLVGIRTCTTEWKIAPCRREIRSIIGKTKKGKHVSNIWIGISKDEESRSKNHVNKLKWLQYRYPLLEKNLSRKDCIKILQEYGWGDTVKSGCFCCPYQSGKQWQALKRNHPELFAISLKMERKAKARPRGFRGGLWRSSKSIEGFDVASLEDFFQLYIDNERPEPTCDVGVCFL